MKILALDPGTHETAWVIYDPETKEIHDHAIQDNDAVLCALGNGWPPDVHVLAIEMVACYGMPVGAEVFETCVWIGRFIEAAKRDHRMVYRRDVKLHLCNSVRAKDANIRQALIDAIGPQGKKDSPGPTYGIKSHEWSALGVAVTAGEKL